MSKMKGFSLTSILTFLVLCFMGTSFVSASPGEVPDYKPVADEMIGSNGITWLPKVEYARLVLTVAKLDGTVIKKTFDSGSTPYINLSDLLRDNSCDGSYTYELRVIPNADKQNMGWKPLTQTGYFLIQGGAIVTPGAPGGLDRVQDIVHDDDVIITGHLGVGSCCTEDMYFGLDRVIICGATPWVLFKDTSTSPFPTNDWRIVVNDGTSGSDLFSIEDVDAGSKRIFTLEAGAPESSLYVDSNGRIGLGTSTPAFRLHMETTGENAIIVLDRTDGARAYMNATTTHANFGSKTDHPVRLIANKIPILTCEPGGDVGIGLTNPNYKLHIVGGAYCDGGAWVPGSSREYKENITNLTLDEAIEALEGLTPVKFNYKTNKEEDYMGFIAEDVPELVATRERKGVAPMDVVSVLTKVVQEQQKTISELKKKIADLEKK